MQHIEKKDRSVVDKVTQEKQQGQSTAPAVCPIHAWSWQKTAQRSESSSKSIKRDAKGVWHIRSYDPARQLLRHDGTQQAGFNAEMIANIPNVSNVPVLYQEGKEHQQQRKQTARYFAPKTVSENYRTFMEHMADRLIRRFKKQGKAELSDLSMQLAVTVAARVVGLTNSYPGLTRRLNAFFENDPMSTHSRWSPAVMLHELNNRTRMLTFFYLDVLPAIRARRHAPQDDVISHLLSKNYNHVEILTECMTYGAAGMITTREFICVAAWHLMEQPELRRRYLEAGEEERYQILHEILRVEPVVSHLYRRAATDIELHSDGERSVIPKGDMIDIHLYGANFDEEVVGDLPLAVCPEREIRGSNIPSMLMSFGDGIHRCPGAYIAIQETDIFLHRLLAIENLVMTRKPSVTWDESIAAYELRHFTLTLGEREA